MQDTSTGAMIPLPVDFANRYPNLEKISGAERKAQNLSAEIERLTGIPAARQGPIFREGQIVEINGGRFAIKKIIKKGLVLHGISKS